MSYKKVTWNEDDSFTPEQANDMSATLEELDAQVVSEIGDDTPTQSIAKNGFFIKREVVNGNEIFNIYQVQEDGSLVLVQLNAKTFDGKTLEDFDVEELKTDVQQLNQDVKDIESGTKYVGVARSIYSPTKTRDDEALLYRTTGGETSLGNGDAYLYRVGGYTQLPQITPASASVQINSSSSVGVSIDDATFIAAIDNTQGTYTFSYSGSTWSLNSSDVDLNTYGITISGTPISGDNLVVIYDEIVSYNYYPAEVSYSVTVDVNYFKWEVNSSGAYTFEFNGSNWTLNSYSVNLASYGIAIDGTPTNGDSFTVNFTQEVIVGNIVNTLPRKFVSLGLNQFDKNTMIIENATIDSNNVIISSQGEYVAYCRVPINAYKSKDTNFTVYSQSGSITKLGISTQVPTMGSSILAQDGLVTYSEETSYINFTNEELNFPNDVYYVVVSTTNIDDLCIHPTWSGYMDNIYQEFTESVINLPYSSIEPYGLVAIGNSKDYLDSVDKEYVRKNARIPYTKQNLLDVLDAGRDYIYDANYIYYTLSNLQVVTIPVSFDGEYLANDFGCEYVTGTNVPCMVKIDYQTNLVDKLRTDVLTISSQELTSSQKEQVWANLGLYDLSEEEY